MRLVSNADQSIDSNTNQKHDILTFKKGLLTWEKVESLPSHVTRSLLAKDLDIDLVSRSRPVTMMDLPLEVKPDDTAELAAESTLSEPTLAFEPDETDETTNIAPTTQPEITKTSEESIQSLINAYRHEHGLPELSGNRVLDQAAQIRAQEISVCLSHERPDGQPFYTVFSEIGFDTQLGAENFIVASAGYYSAEAIVQAWIDSPVHRANILDANFTSSGISRIRSGDQEVFVQLFAS